MKETPPLGEVSPQLDGLGSVYCENMKIAEVVTVEDGLNINDITDQKGVQAYAVDPESATRLWNLSERCWDGPSMGSGLVVNGRSCGSPQDCGPSKAAVH
jgi:hypothetical protein